MGKSLVSSVYFNANEDFHTMGTAEFLVRYYYSITLRIDEEITQTVSSSGLASTYAEAVRRFETKIAEYE